MPLSPSPSPTDRSGYSPPQAMLISPPTHSGRESLPYHGRSMRQSSLAQIHGPQLPSSLLWFLLWKFLSSPAPSVGRLTAEEQRVYSSKKMSSSFYLIRYPEYRSKIANAGVFTSGPEIGNVALLLRFLLTTETRLITGGLTG